MKNEDIIDNLRNRETGLARKEKWEAMFGNPKPQFKVGDWVTFVDTTDDWGSTRQFVELVTNIDEDFGSFSSKNQIFFVKFDKVELWLPEIGDDVWSRRTTKAESGEEIHETVLNKVTETKPEESTVLLNDGRTVHVCNIAPFNGDLPEL